MVHISCGALNWTTFFMNFVGNLLGHCSKINESEIARELLTRWFRVKAMCTAFAGCRLSNLSLLALCLTVKSGMAQLLFDTCCGFKMAGIVSCANAECFTSSEPRFDRECFRTQKRAHERRCQFATPEISIHIENTRAIDSWSLHGCIGFPIPVLGVKEVRFGNVKKRL